MPAVTANSITIEYEEHGNGEPLLLIMGLAAQLRHWPADFIAHLVDEGFRVITFDNRDIGLSTEFKSDPPKLSAVARAMLLGRKLESEYLLSDMADDAAGLLDVLDIKSAHVAGASMGGMIAQALAIAHPTRVRSLTSVMSTTGNRKVGQPSKRMLARIARMPTPTPETALDAAIEMSSLISGPTYNPMESREMAEVCVTRSFRPLGPGRQSAAIVASPDRTADLGLVRAPTLVIHGVLDRLVRPSGGVATASAIPGSRLIMYPEMAHDLPGERRAEVASEIRRNANRPHPNPDLANSSESTQPVSETELKDR